MSSGRLNPPMYASASPYYPVAEDRRLRFDPEVFDSPFYNPSSATATSHPYRKSTGRVPIRGRSQRVAPQTSRRPRSRLDSPLRSSAPTRGRVNADVDKEENELPTRRRETPTQRPTAQPLAPPRPRKRGPNPITVALESICDPPDREMKDVSGEYNDDWEDTQSKLDRIRFSSMKAR